MKHRIPLFFLLLLIGFSVSAEESDTDEPIEYLSMKPEFVVNLQGNKRSYLRTDIELLIENKERAEKIKAHMPALRHALIMLISEYSADQLSDLKQREDFRKKALTETRNTLDKYASSEGLTDLFFTEFLVQ